MKFLIYSDIHTEFSRFKAPEGLDYDVVILAGDIGVGEVNPQEIVGNTKPFIYIPGNHEYYDGSDVVVKKEFEAPLVTRFESVDGPVRVIATTLWTDFKLLGDPVPAMVYARHYMNDFNRIRCMGRRFMPSDWLREHEDQLERIQHVLESDRNVTTVIVTHHAPSIRSCDPQYREHESDMFYASNLEWLMALYKPTLWVHGHVHKSNDYYIGSTRVVSNPRGYVRTSGTRHARENLTFDPGLVIDVR